MPPPHHGEVDLALGGNMCEPVLNHYVHPHLHRAHTENVIETYEPCIKSTDYHTYVGTFLLSRKYYCTSQSVDIDSTFLVGHLFISKVHLGLSWLMVWAPEVISGLFLRGDDIIVVYWTE